MVGVKGVTLLIGNGPRLQCGVNYVMHKYNFYYCLLYTC
jgi:hypothetical protein